MDYYFDQAATTTTTTTEPSSSSYNMDPSGYSFPLPHQQHFLSNTYPHRIRVHRKWAPEQKEIVALYCEKYGATKGARKFTEEYGIKINESSVRYIYAAMKAKK